MYFVKAGRMNSCIVYIEYSEKIFDVIGITNVLYYKPILNQNLMRLRCFIIYMIIHWLYLHNKLLYSYYILDTIYTFLYCMFVNFVHWLHSNEVFEAMIFTFHVWMKLYKHIIFTFWRCIIYYWCDCLLSMIMTGFL